MLIKGIVSEDFVNYKKCCMTIEFPRCDFKCDKECGIKVCQNSGLVKAPTFDISIGKIVKAYLNNSLTESICFQGLEPLDSKKEMFDLIRMFRKFTNDDIIIYTGYTEEELKSKIQMFQDSGLKNIIIKFGRFIPNQPSHFDEILGVYLASSNQYAKKIC